MDAHSVQFVRVTTDDRTFQLWAVATARENAVDRILEGIPEGWSACLLEASFTAKQEALSNMRAGEIRLLSDALD